MQIKIDLKFAFYFTSIAISLVLILLGLGLNDPYKATLVALGSAISGESVQKFRITQKIFHLYHVTA